MLAEFVFSIFPDLGIHISANDENVVLGYYAQERIAHHRRQ